MKRTIQGFCLLMLIVCGVLWGAVLWLANYLPGQFYVVEGGSLQLNSWVSASVQQALPVQTRLVKAGENYTASLNLFGIVPVKKATVKVVDLPVVVACGTPFGIKMYTNGALVVGLTDVETDGGLCNPAKEAGIQMGDILLSVDGETIRTTKDVAYAVEHSGGDTLTFCVRRDSLEFDVSFTPVLSATENTWKAGMWVRDSAAGIGTMTFYDPETGVFAGLGHAVCDADTGDTLSISSGEAVNARIYSVRKGLKGNPGELLGGFDFGSLGSLMYNSETGVYGVMEHAPVSFMTVPVAMKQEVHTGEVEILTTVSGTTPQLYKAVIEQIHFQSSAATRNMVISITDPDLLEQTGGIVQGMSGSPILQDGKLIGAVTHVFVNDPTRGYAIFAENMLATTQLVAEQSLKEAS